MVWASVAQQTAASQLPQLYRVIGLNLGYASEPHDVNNSGLCVGNRGFDSNGQPVYWPSAGSTAFMTKIGSQYNNGSARALNDGGMIVGWLESNATSAYQTTYHHAAAWNSGVPRWLPESLAAKNSDAWDVNSDGVIVGQWDTLSPGTYSNVNFHAAAWLQDGTLLDLSKAGENASTAYAVNASGTAVGYRSEASGSYALKWTLPSSAGGATVETNLTAGLQGTSFRATAINDQGLIAGTYRTTAGAWVPFLYDTQIQPLAFPAGMSNITSCSINEVNNIGTAVGAITANSQFVPTIWRDGQAYDLNKLLEAPYYYSGYPVTFNQAYAINDLGIIAVTGSTPSPIAGTSAYLLVPIPEPSAFTLLLAAACGLAFAWQYCQIRKVRETHWLL